jgi:precorrin-3B methylase
MLKYEKGRNRPTEKRAINAIISQDVEKWVAKIDKAAKANINGADCGVEAVTTVLKELAKEIREDRVDIEVFKGVIRRRNVTASLGRIIRMCGNNG